MSRLLMPLMAGLLCIGTAQARELHGQDPVRSSLVALARDTQAAGLPADSRLSLSRAWVEGSQAEVCAVARGADGDLLVREGRLQMKQVFFRKQGSQWKVERAKRIVMSESDSIDTACGRPSTDTMMAAALKEMDAHPPTAGIVNKAAHTSAKATVNCDAGDAADSKPGATEPSGRGVVSLPGRSLLHTTPDLACYMGKHIVGGDKVIIQAQVPGWTKVSYTHPITHVTTVGWVKSERVKRMDDSGAQKTALNP